VTGTKNQASGSSSPAKNSSEVVMANTIDEKQDTTSSTYTLENLFIAGATRKKMNEKVIEEWLEECEYSNLRDICNI
jgi:hypothetical protein